MIKTLWCVERVVKGRRSFVTAETTKRSAESYKAALDHAVSMGGFPNKTRHEVVSFVRESLMAVVCAHGNR